MIDKEIYDYSKEALIYYLRFEAGSSNPEYFHAKKAGGLKLQQVPEEYSELLLLLKQFGAETYLGLGIGNGGSFAMECFFMKDTLKKAVAVDNLAYKDLGIGQNEIEIKSFIENTKPFVKDDCEIVFNNSTTDFFFSTLYLQETHQKTKGEKVKFDVIFIDADHSYEGARKDYDNALKHIEPNGLIIFHDINSAACPGIQRLWQEAKADHKCNWELIASKTCGIGVIQVK